MMQRPDLFGACIPDGRRDRHAPLPPVHRRPVLARRIRLRSTTKTSSRSLLAYSPYHNIKQGTKYPPTLDHDRRHRRPRGADAQLQVRRRAASGPRRATPRSCCASKPAPATAPARRSRSRSTTRPTAGRSLVKELRDEPLATGSSRPRTAAPVAVVERQRRHITRRPHIAQLPRQRERHALLADRAWLRPWRRIARGANRGTARRPSPRARRRR